MPMYDYRCKSCGNEFEIMQSIHDDTLSACPDCHGHVFRLISNTVGIAFKGSGFYATDSKKETKPTPSPSTKNP